MVDPYYAVCCQIGTPSIKTRDQASKVLDKVDEFVGHSVHQFRLMYPVKLVVFPECIQGWGGFSTNKGLQKVAIEMPGEETDRLGEIAKKYKVYLAPGSWFEKDPEYSLAFNTFPLFNPKGELSLKYRKVNPYIPVEFSQSPFDIPDYTEELFPVAETEIGNLGLYICYDQMFPEVTRQLTMNGAEVLVECSAYMDPWTLGEVDHWTWTSRVRSMENLAFGVCCQQGSGLKEMGGVYSWGGHSMIVDYEGRLLAEAGRGECIIGSQINIDALRHHRKQVRQHNMLAHLKTGAYNYLQKEMYPKHPEFLEKGELTEGMLDKATRNVMKRIYK